MRRISIVGAGFCGTLVAVQLLRHAPSDQGLHIALIEREPRRLNRGFAYSTPHDACVLNVPAGRMSAFDDDTDHFVRWAQEQDRSIAGATFVPRRMYGHYLASVLAKARKEAPADCTVECVTAEAITLDDSDGSITLVDERTIKADQIVLALGNFSPCDPAGADAEFLAGANYTRNPWAPGALENLPTDVSIVLIGTGLTMLDVALVLEDSGHRGPIHAISRRGLVPQAHRVSTTPPPLLPLPESLRIDRPTPLKLLRALRHEIELASKRGDDWREVVTALRHETPMLWQSLDARGKKQFLRHLLPFWETHRHRAAPLTAQRIHQLREQKRLVIHAARIFNISHSGKQISVTLRVRGRNSIEQLHVGHVINCTGPDMKLARCGGALIRSAIERGIVKVDDLGLGLEVAHDGAVIRADGSVSQRIFTVGPLRKAQLWETTAVPELRVQAAELAQRLLR